MLIDSHTHILSEIFNLDRNETRKRAKNLGIQKFIDICYNKFLSKEVVNFEENNNDFFVQ